MKPSLEAMEPRLVMSHAAVAHLAMAHPLHAQVANHQKAPKPIPSSTKAMSITGLVVNDVALSGNQLIANANLNGIIKGSSFSLPLAIPLSLTSATPSAPSAAAAAPTQILHLTLGPIDLSLLGLNVHLGADCTPNSTAPITATITAIPTGSTFTSGGVTYQGGLLGDVLSGVANLLNGGTGGLLGGLGSVAPLPGGTGALAGLGSELEQLEVGLTQILNGTGGTSGLLGGLSSGNVASGGGATPMAVTLPPNTHEVLELPLGPINLDLLGALVQTSPICLNITATRGPGKLLGNLL